MQLDEFKQLVADHQPQYLGVRPHSESELTKMEGKLGFAFPESVRWLLKSHGYGEATGIGSLDESVQTTLACRNTIGLPQRWLILNDWGDAGVVMLDSATSRVCWCASHDVERIAHDGVPLTTADWYESFGDWSKSRLEEALEEGSL